MFPLLLLPRFGERRLLSGPVRLLSWRSAGRATLQRNGLRGGVARVTTMIANPVSHASSYNELFRSNKLNNRDRSRQQQEAAQFSFRPTISVLTPVYNTDPTVLRQAIESVREQTYPYWELCLVNDGSTSSLTAKVLDECAALDARIKVEHRATNGGIVAASNDALAMATGEFVALLDHDDELAPEAFFAVARLLNEHPDADMIYTDEDKIKLDGLHFAPFVKPDWSPEYFLTCMYTCHLGIYRRALVEQVGAFRNGFDGAQDYDLALRITERTNRIHHVPQILYHWRALPESTAADVSAKPYAHRAAQRAINDYLNRNSIAAECLDGPVPSLHRVQYKIVGQPLVSIVVPTAGVSRRINHRDIDLLANCVRSIVEQTEYENYEIICVDNGDLRESTKTALNSLKDKRLRLISFTAPFNLAEKMNYGAAAARGEHLLFLNDDTEVKSNEWIRALLEFSQQPKIGAVGAKLYFPNGTIQHAGVIIPHGSPGHAHYKRDAGDYGYFSDLVLPRNYSAVTGACMMTRRQVFEEIGGFNKVFPLNYNDVEYCLQVRERGYRIVFTPYAELLHYESVSRDKGVRPEELQLLRDRWGDKIDHDPYYYESIYRQS